MIEQINKVELQGYVGQVRFYPVAGPDSPRMVRFNMATEYVSKPGDGRILIDTTWHSLSILENKANELNWLEKGKPVHVTGRIRTVKVIDSENVERTITEIVAEDVYQVKE